MKRLALFLVLAMLALLAALVATTPARAATQVELFTDPAAFKARLAGGAFPVKTVTFDGIRATATTAVSFRASKYKVSHGMIIKGEGGQYVSRGFRFPKEMIPVSGRNMYAPGPVAWTGPEPSGGNETDVTFSAGGRSILAAGFGCYFIDADYPAYAPSGFTIHDAANAQIGSTGVVDTGNAKHLFVGLVTYDDVSNLPVAGISRVHIVNGDGWPGNDNNEGVALDSFMAGTATYNVAGKVVRRSGKPLGGVRITLKGAFTVRTATKANGRYTIPNVPPGAYKVTPSKKGYRFTPSRRTATVLAANVTLARFRAR